MAVFVTQIQRLCDAFQMLEVEDFGTSDVCCAKYSGVRFATSRFGLIKVLEACHTSGSVLGFSNCLQSQQVFVGVTEMNPLQIEGLYHSIFGTLV